MTAGIDGGPETPAYQSKRHVAWIGDFEYLLVGSELARAPVHNTIDLDSGQRAGARFESKMPAAASVLSVALAAESGGEPAWWMPEAERLLGQARTG